MYIDRDLAAFARGRVLGPFERRSTEYETGHGRYPTQIRDTLELLGRQDTLLPKKYVKGFIARLERDQRALGAFRPERTVQVPILGYATPETVYLLLPVRFGTSASGLRKVLSDFVFSTSKVYGAVNFKNHDGFIEAEIRLRDSSRRGSLVDRIQSGPSEFHKANVYIDLRMRYVSVTPSHEERQPAPATGTRRGRWTRHGPTQDQVIMAYVNEHDSITPEIAVEKTGGTKGAVALALRRLMNARKLNRTGEKGSYVYHGTASKELLEMGLAPSEGLSGPEGVAPTVIHPPEGLGKGYAGLPDVRDAKRPGADEAVVYVTGLIDAHREKKEFEGRPKGPNEYEWTVGGVAVGRETARRLTDFVTTFKQYVQKPEGDESRNPVKARRKAANLFDGVGGRPFKVDGLKFELPED